MSIILGYEDHRDEWVEKANRASVIEVDIDEEADMDIPPPSPTDAPSPPPSTIGANSSSAPPISAPRYYFS